MRWPRLVAVMAVALALGACDWGPRGPGQLKGVVTTGPTRVGALVLDVFIMQTGFRGFSEVGQTRLFAATPGKFQRLVLIASDPDRIRFRVDMDDVRSVDLFGVVVEAVDDNNEPIVDLSGITVEFRR